MEPEIPSTIVAVVLLVVVAAVMIFAIAKYKTADEALKIIAALSGLMGIAAGSFVSYFFTHGQAEAARHEAAAYKVEADNLQRQASALQTRYFEKEKDFAGLKDATAKFAYSISSIGNMTDYDQAAATLKDKYGIFGVPMTPALKLIPCEPGKTIKGCVFMYPENNGRSPKK